jgi:hypothetical protein
MSLSATVPGKPGGAASSWTLMSLLSSLTHHCVHPRRRGGQRPEPACTHQASQCAGCSGRVRTCYTHCPVGRRCHGSSDTVTSTLTTSSSTPSTSSSAWISAPSPSGFALSSRPPPPREGWAWPPCTTPSTTCSSSASRSLGPTPGSPTGCFVPASSIPPPG